MAYPERGVYIYIFNKKGNEIYVQQIDEQIHTTGGGEQLRLCRLHKKILSAVLTAAVVSASGVFTGSAGAIPAAPHEEPIIWDSPVGSSSTDGDLKFTKGVGDYYVSINGNKSEVTSVTIPSTYNGKQVFIRDRGFANCTNLKSVTISEGIKTISDSTFEGCTALTTVNLPNSIETIERDAFRNTAILNNQDTDVKYVGNWAVFASPDAKSIKIKDGTIGISDNVFLEYAPNPLSGGLLAPKKKLTEEISFPDSLKYIGADFFSGCTNLRSIALPSTMKEIPESLFSGCTNLTSVTIPNSVTRIGAYAFRGCEKLTSIQLPAGVTHIYTEAFKNCKSLTKINLENIKFLEKNAFDNTPLLTKQNGLTYAAGWLVKVDDNVTDVNIRAGTVGTAEYSLFDRSFRKITFPNGIKIIDMRFVKFTGMSELAIPGTVKQIDIGAVYGFDTVFLCEGVEDVEITSYDVKKIYLPQTTTKLKFMFSESITDVYFAGTEAQFKKLGWDGSILCDRDHIISADSMDDQYYIYPKIHYNTPVPIKSTDLTGAPASSYSSSSSKPVSSSVPTSSSKPQSSSTTVSKPSSSSSSSSSSTSSSVPQSSSKPASSVSPQSSSVQETSSVIVPEPENSSVLQSAPGETGSASSVAESVSMSPSESSAITSSAESSISSSGSSGKTSNENSFESGSLAEDKSSVPVAGIAIAAGIAVAAIAAGAVIVRRMKK